MPRTTATRLHNLIATPDPTGLSRSSPFPSFTRDNLMPSIEERNDNGNGHDNLRDGDDDSDDSGSSSEQPRQPSPYRLRKGKYKTFMLSEVPKAYLGYLLTMRESSQWRDDDALYKALDEFFDCRTEQSLAVTPHTHYHRHQPHRPASPSTAAPSSYHQPHRRPKRSFETAQRKNTVGASSSRRLPPLGQSSVTSQRRRLDASWSRTKSPLVQPPVTPRYGALASASSPSQENSHQSLPDYHNSSSPSSDLAQIRIPLPSTPFQPILPCPSNGFSPLSGLSPHVPKSPPSPTAPTSSAALQSSLSASPSASPSSQPCWSVSSVYPLRRDHQQASAETEFFALLPLHNMITSENNTQLQNVSANLTQNLKECEERLIKHTAGALEAHNQSLVQQCRQIQHGIRTNGRSQEFLEATVFAHVTHLAQSMSGLAASQSKLQQSINRHFENETKSMSGIREGQDERQDSVNRQFENAPSATQHFGTHESHTTEPVISRADREVESESKYKHLKKDLEDYEKEIFDLRAKAAGNSETWVEIRNLQKNETSLKHQIRTLQKANTQLKNLSSHWEAAHTELDEPSIHTDSHLKKQNELLNVSVRAQRQALMMRGEGIRQTEERLEDIITDSELSEKHKTELETLSEGLEMIRRGEDVETFMPGSYPVDD